MDVSSNEVRSREVLTVAPASEPIVASSAHAHLRLEGVTLSSTEDTLLDAYIQASREAAENYTDSVLINQTWELWLNRMPEIIKLGKAPINSVSNISYYDADNSSSIFSAGNYQLETLGQYGSQIRVFDNFPDVTTKREFPVVVTYVAGYGTAGTDCPEALNTSVRIMLTNLWEGEEVMTESVRFLLAPYRVFL